jgi:hypothetical protein
MAKATTPRHLRNKAEFSVAQAWQHFYRTPDGRAAIAELMTWCNVYHDTRTTDPYEHAIERGQRSIAIRIINLIGLKPDAAPTVAWDDSDILDRMLNQRQT